MFFHNRSHFILLLSTPCSFCMDSTRGSGRGKGAAYAVVMKPVPHMHTGWRRGVAIFDFILRICGLVAALAAATTMGTSDETLPFFNQFFQFQASYEDLPTFTFFIVTMAITGGYLVLSLLFSIIAIVRPEAAAIKLLLLVFDLAVMAFAISGAAAAAAVVYLAHNGNSTANWLAICQQFTDFCQKVSGAVVAAFLAAAIMMFLVILSALALRRHPAPA